MDNYFVTLNKINVNEHTEKKGKLTYLSWAWAWAEVKKLFPDAYYTIYQNDLVGGLPYFTDGKTAMVKTGVTINGIEHIEMLPIMDNRNAPIPLDAITTFNVNTAVQRSLTKACARHGLGLYIYAGEDLPDDPDAPAQATPAAPAKKAGSYKCEECGAEVTKTIGKDGEYVPAAKIAALAKERTGKVLCAECLKKATS